MDISEVREHREAHSITAALQPETISSLSGPIFRPRLVYGLFRESSKNLSDEWFGDVFNVQATLIKQMENAIGGILAHMLRIIPYFVNRQIY